MYLDWIGLLNWFERYACNLFLHVKSMAIIMWWLPGYESRRRLEAIMFVRFFSEHSALGDPMSLNYPHEKLNARKLLNAHTLIFSKDQLSLDLETSRLGMVGFDTWQFNMLDLHRHFIGGIMVPLFSDWFTTYRLCTEKEGEERKKMTSPSMCICWIVGYERVKWG